MKVHILQIYFERVISFSYDTHGGALHRRQSPPTPGKSIGTPAIDGTLVTGGKTVPGTSIGSPTLVLWASSGALTVGP